MKEVNKKSQDKVKTQTVATLHIIREVYIMELTCCDKKYNVLNLQGESCSTV